MINKGGIYKNVLECCIIKKSSIVEAYNKAEGNTKEFYNQYNKGDIIYECRINTLFRNWL